MLQIGANVMARFGLFGSRFLISSPPPPQKKNVHIKVLILDILESVLTIRHPGLNLYDKSFCFLERRESPQLAASR